MYSLMGLTSQGSGIPMDPGRKSPAASSCHTRLKPSTSVRGSSPIRGITAQLDWEGGMRDQRMAEGRGGRGKRGVSEADER